MSRAARNAISASLRFVLFEKEHAVVVMKVGLCSIESERSAIMLGRCLVLIQSAIE